MTHVVVDTVSHPDPPALATSGDSPYLHVLGQAWPRVFAAGAPRNLAGSNAASQLGLLVC
jgi:hypothetical protein